MSFTAPKTWASGALTSAELNQELRDNLIFLKAALAAIGQTSDSTPDALLSARYGASLYENSITIPDATDTAVAFADTDIWDDDGFHSTVQDNDRITVPATGTYHFVGWGNFNAHADGNRNLWFEVNGATSYARIRIPSAGSTNDTNIGTSIYLELTAGDYVRLMVRQGSGGVLTTCSFRFQCQRVSV